MQTDQQGVLIYSGGLDSTTLLYHLIATNYEVHCLSVHYGQRHRRELDAAREITNGLGIDHRVVNLDALKQLLAGSSLTQHEIDVPVGHYAEESMKATVVPNRNMVLLSLATAWAVSLRAGVVWYGAHSGDHTIYPDCRPEFAQAMREAISLADWHTVTLEAPFTEFSKGDIVARGAELMVPFERTWTCYVGGDRHCGRCGACVERREAFELAGVSDPTEYEVSNG
jgi:7-cyano-7-deazaguanine synthase